MLLIFFAMDLSICVQKKKKKKITEVSRDAEYPREEGIRGT
jgi:hypothetical protein